MKLRKKKEQISYTEGLWNQIDGNTEQLLEEANKEKPNGAKINDLLRRRDYIVRDLSIESDFIKNLEWMKGTLASMGLAVTISGIGLLAYSKLSEK